MEGNKSSRQSLSHFRYLRGINRGVTTGSFLLQVSKGVENASQVKRTYPERPLLFDRLLTGLAGLMNATRLWNRQAAGCQKALIVVTTPVRDHSVSWVRTCGTSAVFDPISQNFGIIIDNVRSKRFGHRNPCCSVKNPNRALGCRWEERPVAKTGPRSWSA